MKVRSLYTEGNGRFQEGVWDKPHITDNEIEVKSILTGICRSDIDMMIGKFQRLPLNMQGHEGLGQVTKVGKDILDVRIGDYVATRGAPSYADYYNTKYREYIRVPEIEPRYILEPVACGINVVNQAFEEIKNRQGKDSRLLVLGSGFLSWIVYNTLLIENLKFQIDVVGSSNKDTWGSVLKPNSSGRYSVVIDLTNKNIFNLDIFDSECLIVEGVGKEVVTNFSNVLWNACTIVFPSPRSKKFFVSMKLAWRWVKSGVLSVDKFWTKGYSRNGEWEKAFEDGLNRQMDYSRGYLDWRK